MCIRDSIKGVIFVDLDQIKAAAGDLALVPLEIEGNVAGDLGIGRIHALSLIHISDGPEPRDCPDYRERPGYPGCPAG